MLALGELPVQRQREPEARKASVERDGVAVPWRGPEGSAELLKHVQGRKGEASCRRRHFRWVERERDRERETETEREKQKGFQPGESHAEAVGEILEGFILTESRESHKLWELGRERCSSLEESSVSSPPEISGHHSQTGLWAPRFPLQEQMGR